MLVENYEINDKYWIKIGDKRKEYKFIFEKEYITQIIKINVNVLMI